MWTYFLFKMYKEIAKKEKKFDCPEDNTLYPEYTINELPTNNMILSLLKKSKIERKIQKDSKMCPLHFKVEEYFCLVDKVKLKRMKYVQIVVYLVNIKNMK